MKRRAALAALCSLALFGARPAYATSCVFNSVTAVAFTPYDVFAGTNVDAVGGFTYQCSLFSALDTVTINLSTGSSNTYSTRTLLNGVNGLNYQLYLDPARTQVWGDKSSGTLNYTSGLNLFAIPVSIYGRIPSGQNAKSGTYGDTITITMLF